MKESIFPEKLGRHHLDQVIKFTTGNGTNQNCMLLNTMYAVIQEKFLLHRKNTLKFLGVMGHQSSNLLSNDFRNKISTLCNVLVHFFLV